MDNKSFSKEIKLLVFYGIAFLLAYLLKFVGAHGGGYDTEYILTSLAVVFIILPFSIISFGYHLYKYYKINKSYSKCLFIHISVWIILFALMNNSNQ